MYLDGMVQFLEAVNLYILLVQIMEELARVRRIWTTRLLKGREHVQIRSLYGLHVALINGYSDPKAQLDQV